MLRNILEKRRSQIYNNSAGRRKSINWAIITTGPIQARSNVFILVPPCKEQQGESCVQFTTQLHLGTHVQSLQRSAYIQTLITKRTQTYKFYYISSRTSLTTFLIVTLPSWTTVCVILRRLFVKTAIINDKSTVTLKL
jgi:hypothetical protein